MIITKNLYILNELFDAFKKESSLSNNYIKLIKLSSILDPKQWLIDVSKDVQFGSFSILFDVEPTEEHIGNLVRMAYLGSFKKDDWSTTIFTSHQHGHLLKSALIDQGFMNVDVIDINTLPYFRLGNFEGFIHYFNPNCGSDILITKLLPINSSIENNIVKQQVSDTLRLLLCTEENTAEQMREIIKENAALKKMVAELSSELKNHKQYLKIALKQKETEHILNFYHQEYEVLPLWYKRFGHIIKIIRGQRKFISKD